MNEKIKREIIFFIAVLVALSVFVGVVETFTGFIEKTREQNNLNNQIIQNISNERNENINQNNFSIQREQATN